MERFDVRAPGPPTLVRQLSGGNIQKVLLARELSSQPRAARGRFADARPGRRRHPVRAARPGRDGRRRRRRSSW